MALGAFWFSVMSLLVKLAGKGMPAMQVVLVRGVLTLLLTALLLARARITPWGTMRGLLVLRGLLGTLGLSAFYISLVHLPLAEASVLQYTNPVFTAVLAALLLNERLGWREALCVAASLGGVLLITRPAALVGGATAALPLAYVAIALLGALSSAAAYVVIRRIGRREPPLVVVFYLPLITVPASAPFAVEGWVWPSAWQWAVLAGIGLSTQVAQLYMTRGLQLEPAARATAVGYLQIVFAAGWGALVFAEYPDGWTMLGAAVIVASTVALAGARSGSGARPAREPADSAIAR